MAQQTITVVSVPCLLHTATSVQPHLTPPLHALLPKHCPPPLPSLLTHKFPSLWAGVVLCAVWCGGATGSVCDSAGVGVPLLQIMLPSHVIIHRPP